MTAIFAKYVVCRVVPGCQTEYTSANSLAKHVRCKHSAILSCTFEEVHPRTEDCDDNSSSGESTIYENQFQCLRVSLFIYRSTIVQFNYIQPPTINCICN